MQVRAAILQDLEMLCSLYEKFYTYNAKQQPEYYQATLESGNYPKSVLQSGCEAILVAEEAGIIAGFIHVAEDKTPAYPPIVQHRFAQVVDLYVEWEYRRQGIGHMLLDEAKRWARGRNLDYLELFVLENNEDGIGFYEREAFRTVSRTMRCAL